MGISKVRGIVLYYVSVDSIVHNLAILEIFYFKPYVEACAIIIFVGNPYVLMQ